MFKKILLVLLVVGMIAILAVACSKSSTDTATVEMTEETELVIGTMKLDGTDLAVDAEEAAQLIPLWDLVSTLKMSGTSTDAEINAVIQQIKDTMTEEQVSAIDAMNLTQEDVASSMSELGIGFGGASGTPDATALANGAFPGMDGSMPSDMGGSAPSGGTMPSGSGGSMPSSGGGMPSGGGGNMPSGGVPGGNMGGSSSSGLSSGQVATFEAQQSSSGTSPQMDSTTMLIRSLLSYLRSVK